MDNMYDQSTGLYRDFNESYKDYTVDNSGLDKILDDLRQLQLVQGQAQANYTQKIGLNEINERLITIEENIGTLFNMLKLILGIQLEKEMRDKENKKNTSQEEES